jgi:hypothetical protein
MKFDGVDGFGNFGNFGMLGFGSCQRRVLYSDVISENGLDMSTTREVDMSACVDAGFGDGLVRLGGLVTNVSIIVICYIEFTLAPFSLREKRRCHV